jgi:hypothetical protein
LLTHHSAPHPPYKKMPTSATIECLAAASTNQPLFENFPL